MSQPVGRFLHPYTTLIQKVLDSELTDEQYQL